MQKDQLCPSTNRCIYASKQNGLAEKLNKDLTKIM